MKKRLLFVLDWFGGLLLIALSLPILYAIASAFVRAMLDRP